MHIDTEEVFKRKFRGFNREVAPEILKIAQGLSTYWPLTIRQIYYQTVSATLLPNNLKEYKRVITILKALRLNHVLPWSAVEDRGRVTVDKRGLEGGLSEFLQWHANAAFKPEQYDRCFLSGQANYVEVSVEKDALSSVFKPPVEPYCTRLNVFRGHPSVTMKNDIAGRYREAIERGQHPVMLYFGDFDPSGLNIPESFQSYIRKEYELDIEVRRIALNLEQAEEHELPSDPDAGKKSDKNYAEWVRRYGKHQSPYELDALHPSRLSDMVTEALQDVYDMDTFAEEMKIERRERAKLSEIRATMQMAMKQSYPREFSFL